MIFKGLLLDGMSLFERIFLAAVLSSIVVIILL